MKKKKTSWKTLAGLVLAASAWRKFSEDLPIHDLIPPPYEVRWEGKRPKPTCPPGQEAYLLPGAQDYSCMTYETFQRLSKGLRL